MIGKITGKLISKNNEHLVIDVGGLGYEVYVTEKIMATMTAIDANQEVSLFTELLVKEDLLQLVGFLSFKEKKWFNLLKSVQGVGAKVALAILNNLTPEDLLKSVRMKNEITFKSVSGVGPRMAQRIIVELSGRKDIMSMSDLKNGIDGEGKIITEENNLISIQESHKDALSALQNLGFKQGEAQEAIEKISGEIAEADASEIIKNALRFLAKGSK
jgi:Holliday junction DNA helicase RuvA